MIDFMFNAFFRWETREGFSNVAKDGHKPVKRQSGKIIINNQKQLKQWKN